MRGGSPRGSRLVHVGLDARLRLIRRDAVLNPDLRQSQRLAPAAGVVDQVLDLPEAELAESHQRAVVALLQDDLDGRLTARLTPFVHEALRPLRFDHAPGNLGVDALLGAPVDPFEHHRSARARVNATAAREPSVESLSRRERVVHLLARRSYEDALLHLVIEPFLRHGAPPSRHSSSAAADATPSAPTRSPTIRWRRRDAPLRANSGRHGPIARAR